MDSNNHSKEQDTERMILEAAAKVFMQKGKLGASMQDIADEAGINRTLLHYYFRNKDRLFNKVFDKLYDQVFPAMLGIISSSRPFLERIGMFIETYSGLLKDNPYLPVFIFQELSLNPERLVSKIRGMGFIPEEILHGLNSELENAGMAGIDPRHFFASMMGMVFFPYIGRPLFQVVAFQNDADAYELFLSERAEQILHFIQLAIAGAGIQKK
jgi:AcrR family transcriptional regulator